LPEIFISDKTASTNDDAKENLLNQPAELSIHLAEQQDAGKGRNGKNGLALKGNEHLSILGMEISSDIFRIGWLKCISRLYCGKCSKFTSK
jgi:biotin-(acetyl-CoA carboxylase) ligase